MSVHRQRLLSAGLLLMAGCGGEDAGDATSTRDGGSPTTDAGTESDAASGGNTDAGTVGASEKVGEFSLQLVAPAGGTAGFTSLLGKVYDGPATADIVWESAAEADGCVLTKPRVPFCDPGCGASVCVDDDVCRKSPTALGAGRVTVSGVQTASGARELSIDPVKNTYQSPSSLPYPAFSEGGIVEVSAAGADFPAFTLSGAGIAPLALSSGDSYPIEIGKPLALSWNAAASGSASRIAVHLDISHHGGAKGQIDCDVDDDGAFSIPASLIDKLVDLGVAGFPTVVVTRVARTTTSTARGRVDLRIYASEERPVTLPGLVSCSSDDDCSSGKRCQDDKTCG